MTFLLGYNLNIVIQLGKLTFGGGGEETFGGGGGGGSTRRDFSKWGNEQIFGQWGDFPSKENLVIEFLNIFSFTDNCDNLNSIDFGSCHIMDGG